MEKRGGRPWSYEEILAWLKDIFGIYMWNEKGGVLIELCIMAFILAGICTGTLEVHKFFRIRREQIIQERNASIQKLRSKAKPLPVSR